MRIVELNKKMADISGISDTAGKSSRKKAEEDSFEDSLRKSMHQGASGPESGIGAGETLMKSGNIESRKKQRFEKSKTESVSIRVQRKEEVREAKEVAIRRIPYAECDRVEVNVLEGYTLKAKLENKSGEDTLNIYVEMKCDNGDRKACLFDASGLRKDSRDVMEKIAYQTVNDR